MCKSFTPGNRRRGKTVFVDVPRRRKSISGNWKSNTGSAMLEQLAVSERHRAWIDHVAQLFGGLDICAIELLVGKDGREYIIEVNDSALSLMGDSQEEDRRQIADLVTAKMQVRKGVSGKFHRAIGRSIFKFDRRLRKVYSRKRSNGLCYSLLLMNLD